MSIGPWHGLADEHAIDLQAAVATILTPATTHALPGPWRGEYDAERARRWIAERDRESPTLLVVDRRSTGPVGLVILHTSDDEPANLRLGYVIRESSWGAGIASEAVAGLVSWARSRPTIRSLSAGVESQNAASAHVLLKSGFALTDRDAASRMDTYTLEL